MKRLISILMVCALVIVTFTDMNTICAKAAQSSGKYIALGDSIAAGFGLPNASQSYYAKVKSSLMLADAENLGVTGADSVQLLASLQSPSVQASLKQAKVITISIGSNDLLRPFTSYVKQAFGVDDLSQLGGMVGSMDLLKLMGKLDTLQTLLDSDAENAQGMAAGVNKFAANFPQIIQNLKKICPGAEIYVNNLYNPYRGISLGLLDIGSIAENYITQINKSVFSASSTDYHLVDVYSSFRSKDGLVNANLFTSNFDPHPNAEGHKKIASLYCSSMKTYSKFISLTIKKIAIPKIKRAVKVRKSRKAIVQIKKILKVTGYQIKLSTSKKFTKNTVVKTVKKVTVQMRKLKPNRRYYVKVRAYVTVKGKKTFGAWSPVKTIKFI